jgi:hypothetical protein
MSNYNFDISLDESEGYDYLSKRPSPPSNKLDVGRRRSVDERAREILERNRASAKVPDDNTFESPFTNYESAYKELLDGISLNQNEKPSQKPVKESITSPLSPTGDSFDISAADLEVGTIAAKRLKERAAERGRRMSFDQEMYSSSSRKDKLKQTFSPEIKVIIIQGFGPPTVICI